MQSYKQLLRDVLTDGEPHDDRTGVGTTSLFGYTLRHDMRTGFPLLTTKRVFFRGATEELRWMLQGRTDAKWLQERRVHLWDEWATEAKCAEFGRAADDLGPTYGAMWRRYPVGMIDAPSPQDKLAHETHCQIEQLLKDLKRSPRSRRLILSAWHPWWSRRVHVPPCQPMIQLKVHADESLSMLVYSRSSDAFLGLPMDLAAHGLLLLCFCSAVQREPRELIVQFGDLHVYDNHRAQVSEQLSRECRPLPKVHVTVQSDLMDFITELRDYDPWPAIVGEVAI